MNPLNNMKMKNIPGFIILIILLVAGGCSDIWDKHYNVVPETTDQDIWEVLEKDQEVSLFVNALKEFKYDTIFKSVKVYTYFIPTNQAINQFLAGHPMTKAVLDYHIVTHFIQANSISEKRRVQTLALKLALFERNGGNSNYDGIPLRFESPLYRNGKYYKMDQVAMPKPTFYEYYIENNPLLRDYIDSRDSVVLDREKSRPIGFNDEGMTIYDTVAVTLNNFEIKYFPVKQELRNITATIVFPRKEKYEDALTVMAQKLGGNYKTHEDIPVAWQNEILIPYLLEKGVFLNMLDEEEFIRPAWKDTLKLLNILGDSVAIDYMPVDRAVCSNGIAYDYENFVISDSLFSGRSRFEGEALVREVGVNKFTWRDSVKLISDQSFAPLRQYIPGASKDSILSVSFNKGYNQRFIVEFKTRNLFPRRYRVVVRTQMDIGGKYDIYTNNQLARSFDYYDYIRYRGVLPSVQTPIRFAQEGRFNRFDFWMENQTEYGQAVLRFEYKGPLSVAGNGLVIDYIEFIPY